MKMVKYAAARCMILQVFVSGSDCFTIGEVRRSCRKHERARSLSLVGHRIEPSIPNLVFSNKSLRAFLVLCRWWDNQASAHFSYSNIKNYRSRIFRSWRYLRVIHVSGTQIKDLPELAGGGG